VTDATVSLSGVSFGFGDHAIVEDVSLSVDGGEFVGLVGPNGSGKTTVLELVAGLRTPDAGRIDRPDAERSVAYLPQSPAFRPGFTARETVGYYAGLVDADPDPVDYLARVGLADAADRRVEALSGGMTRLLGLAQALVGDPPVVVLDEPTSGLDPDMADRIFDVLAELLAADRVLFVASHDLAAVEAHANRVLLLAGGRVRLEGSPARIREATGTETLRAAFSAALDRPAERGAEGETAASADETPEAAGGSTR
jgi:ABC-type multidrug transport system ATPase subunit